MRTSVAWKWCHRHRRRGGREPPPQHRCRRRPCGGWTRAVDPRRGNAGPVVRGRLTSFCRYCSIISRVVGVPRNRSSWALRAVRLGPCYGFRARRDNAYSVELRTLLRDTPCRTCLLTRRYIGDVLMCNQARLRKPDVIGQLCGRIGLAETVADFRQHGGVPGFPVGQQAFGKLGAAVP